MLRFLYCCWQVLMLPILICNTLMCAIITIIFFPFKNSAPIHWVQMWWCKMFFYLLFLPVSVDGEEHIDSKQSYVFVANHASMFDVWLIYGWLPVVFKWMMKAELRKVPFVGTACKVAGHIYVNRTNLRKSKESIEEVKKILHDGVSTVIFPEGTRSMDGQLQRFRRGAFQIALDLNLPIVPLSLSGCYEVMKKDELFAHRHPVHLHIGEPIDLNQLREQLHETETEALHDEAIMNYVRDKVAENIRS